MAKSKKPNLNSWFKKQLFGFLLKFGRLKIERRSLILFVTLVRLQERVWVGTHRYVKSSRLYSASGVFQLVFRWYLGSTGLSSTATLWRVPYWSPSSLYSLLQRYEGSCGLHYFFSWAQLFPSLWPPYGQTKPVKETWLVNLSLPCPGVQVDCKDPLTERERGTLLDGLEKDIR